MTDYNLLVTEPLSNRVVAEALAQCFRVPVSDVDVADEKTDQNTRHWDAMVLCGTENLRGDVRTSLDIYARDSVQPQPSEPELAAALARVLGHSVLYPAEEFLQGVPGLAAADGTVTRARLLDPGEDPHDETAGYKVDAVEAPVTDLPNAQVTRLPEIVRYQRKPTPVRDGLVASLNILGTGRTDDIGSPYWTAATNLGAWEKLVRTKADDWAPAGWYPPDLYVQTLSARDELEALQPQLPVQAAELLEAAVDLVDREFIKLTVPDPAWYLDLRTQGLDVPDPHDAAWWWTRRPDPLPW
ncbi:hypothetical protein [Actinacidiphila bryophytorum]|uniref:Uncharacterized protein n=2 Tax=Actinacidiphila bryophytorum TaxID=1436133 RepID=A0A9W4MIB1_9ACTN|nr:hypothetical protein [Actinacidiphila bryophytorum]MBM9435750.1 hypothetical protein [Actinacidiphila bryophytorum]CAG7650410.1 conserved hypothetical protein [Actinacidiphila bryophytorum]